MATTYSYDDRAIRESLLDMIVNIDPTEDYLYRTLTKSSADQPYHQWLKDTLKSPELNAQVEGADASFAARTNPSRSANYTQIIRVDFQVSGSDRESNSAGFQDRYTYEMQKAMKEWRRDAEFSIVRGTMISGSGSASRQMAGIKTSITTLNTSQSGVSFSENILNDYLQNAWSQGGNVDTILVGGRLKRRISGFTSANTRFVDAPTEKVFAAVDVYESDFGRVEMVKHRYITVSGDTNNDVVGIEKGKWAVAHLREPKYVPLAKTGDSEKGMILGELTLEARAENSSFIGQRHL